MVQFRDARFGYRPDHPVLDSVSFTVARGYVEQNAPAISGTVRENLTLAAPEVTDEQCWAALDTVNLRDRIDTETAALHAQIGEHGIRLSGGERQRFGAQHVP
ncbi:MULTISPECIES: ABC transporter ATP-binding protein/permease [unclassified Rhodococcus (in: high G+C Gram-positive bacteria)]|uniref:ABC transporter ATP-binding protein/permease n=1 Tax=unclassified Rhodococcus (in: high G+C Gram-positive bacteria) TaxID=192944 RepID=UPI0002FA72D7|nr:ABC transporter ATP-binding protein/permease [Rhodococcus sp. DK17]